MSDGWFKPRLCTKGGCFGVSSSALWQRRSTCSSSGVIRDAAVSATARSALCRLAGASRRLSCCNWITQCETCDSGVVRRTCSATQAQRVEIDGERKRRIGVW